MSYFEKIITSYADSPNLDAFARLRMSSPATLFDSKQLYDSGSLVWNTQLVGGANAQATYDQNKACMRMVASGSATRVVRQTRRRFNYQSGKSQAIVCTANLKKTSAWNYNSVIERVGYFDENNGVYFTYSGSRMGIGVRTKSSGTVTDTFISQSSWNMDTFNGAGPSGNTLDVSKSQIFFWDLEWLGVGRVRYGIYQGGIPIYVHEITNTNALSQDSVVYMSTPNLPIRYEIINSGSVPARMDQICSTVISEGGVDTTGPLRTVDFPTNTTINVGGNATCALIAIRLKSTHISSTVRPVAIGAINTSGANGFKYVLALNPTLAGAALSWTDVPNSAVQYAVAAATNTVNTDGTKLISGYVSAAADNVGVPFDNSLSLGTDIDGTSDVLVLYVSNMGASAQNMAGSITYQETV